MNSQKLKNAYVWCLASAPEQYHEAIEHAFKRCEVDKPNKRLFVAKVRLSSLGEGLFRLSVIDSSGGFRMPCNKLLTSTEVVAYCNKHGYLPTRSSLILLEAVLPGAEDLLEYGE